MYELGQKDYAADFFKTQEDLKNSQTNRAIAEAAELRTQSKFSREQQVQQIADNTLQNLLTLNRGGGNSTKRGVEALANDALNVGKPGDKQAPPQINESTPKVEPADYTLGQMANNIGNALMRAGYASEGMGFAKEGIEYYANIAKAENDRANDQINRAEKFIKIADFMYENLADVTDQQQQDQFFDSLPDDVVNTLGPENVQKMRNMPFDENVIQHYRDKALSTKDTYMLNLQAERNQLTADRDAAMALDRKARAQIAEQQRRDRAAAAAAKTKGAGANAMVVAQPNEVKQATTKIVADVYKGAMPRAGSPDRVMLESAAGSIATEAKQMAKDNPGLTYDQALSRVVALRRGDFIPTEKQMRYTFLGMPVSPTFKEPGPIKYQPRGESKERPIVLKSQAEAGKLVPGRWYSFNGKTMQYNP